MNLNVIETEDYILSKIRIYKCISLDFKKEIQGSIELKKQIYEII